MTDSTTVDIDTDDLNTFEKEFFGTAEALPTEDEDSSDDLGEDDNPPATDDDEPEDEVAETEDEDEDEVEEEAPKPKKKSAQERINELTAKAREAERKAADAIRRAEAAEAAVAEKSTKPKDEPKPIRDILPADAPNPDALDDDGEPVYPLGEFDPKFITDLTRFTIGAETKAAKEAAHKEAVQAQIDKDRVELQSQWQTRVTEVEKEFPDFREITGEFVDSLTGIDEGYGEYLATTVMTSEYGPQIMYYLSQNIGEAQKIIASGPAAATFALGRLEAQFVKKEVKERNKKVSDAPTPPETGTRGRGGRFGVASDTDDLDAFEREFYKKR
jgi:hypothetical protein